MRKTLLLILLFYTSNSKGQNVVEPVSPTDSLTKVLTEKFSITRMVDIKYEFLTPRNFSSKLSNQDKKQNKITDNHRLKAAINIPLLQNRRSRLTYSLLYNYEEFNVKPKEEEAEQKKVDLQYFNSVVSYTYFASLFKKMIVYNGSFMVDGSQEHIEGIKVMASAIMVLKKTDKTTMTVGLMGFYDPGSQIPVFPIFTYKHKFKQNLQLDFIFPQRLLVQTRILKSGLLSLGSELGGTTFYIRSKDIIPDADKFEFHQTELKTGISYEHLLNKSIVLTAKMGVMNVINSKLAEKGEFFENDYLIKYKPKTSAYFNIGFSFNPF